jgi:hypothetical protein
MKALFILLILLFTAASRAREHGAFDPVAAKASELSIDETKAIRRHNSAVTDDEIIAWFEFDLMHDNFALQEWRNKILTIKQRKSWLIEYRSANDRNNAKIPILASFTAKELEQMAALAPLRARMYAKVRWARTKISASTYAQHEQITQACIALIGAKKPQKGMRRRSPERATSNFPESLDFLQLDMMDIDNRACSFYLQKGPGKGIGYHVELSPVGATLSSFDQYVSWQRKEISLFTSR